MVKKYYIGIMSGTSLDAVDVVLCEINTKECKLLHSMEYPLSFSFKEEILSCIEQKIPIAKIGEIDNRLALLFSKAVLALLSESNIKKEEIVAIGSHGQTLWHQPTQKYGFTMQLGDPNLIAVKTGISVVSDFRRKDVALGGEGAPFAPAFHEFMFSQIEKKTAVLNIGGMANITILQEKLIGYDTGCGNVLLDLWIGKHRGLKYDKDGLWAKSGKVDVRLLETMQKDDYFSLPYPKSTGREKFNDVWLQKMISLREKHLSSVLKTEDVQRTLLELVVWSIAKEVKKFDIELLLLCGGGAKNSFLIERILELLPNVDVEVAPYADEIEAMTFAWLAYKRIHKEEVNLKDVTGATKNSVLGGVYV